MRKVILDTILEEMEQVGDLKKERQSKRTGQNAFKLGQAAMRYKRSDMYPAILNVPNPNRDDADPNCWADRGMNHIETGEREVPAEYLKLAWKYAWNQEQTYENKYKEDKTIMLRDYINEHDARLRIRFKELVSEEKYNVMDKQYTAMQWLVWIMIIEEKEHFSLYSQKQSGSKYYTGLDTYKMISEKFSEQIKKAGNIFILYGRQFIGKSVFAGNCLPGLAHRNGCYILDCGQKPFIEFLESLRNRQDDFWSKFKEEERDRIVLPYDTVNIGLRQNLLRLKEIGAGYIVVWDNIASHDLNDYIGRISEAEFQFKSVLVVNMAVMVKNIKEKIPEYSMIQFPGLSDKEMRLVADSIFLKTDRKLKNRMDGLPLEDKKYLEQLMPDLNGNIALLELVIRYYLALKRKWGQDEAGKFLKHMQNYQDTSPADRKTAKFKKTGTTSNFDNNIRTVFQKSISSEERLKITVLSLLNGQRIHEESLQRYFKISGGRFGHIS